jgi:cyclopropane-fatty-acyl-phospholipid synthase
MWLLDKALRNYVRSGEIRLIDHDGTNYRYGSSDGGFGSVTVRLTDSGVARDIVRDPGLGAAEAFMDGRLIIDEGQILDLINIIRGSHRWEDSKGPNPFLRKGSRIGHLLRTLNWKPAALRNVSHHYDVGNDFYQLFLDPDLQYSCGYFTDPANSIEQAQLDKKTHVAAKLRRAGIRCSDIGCAGRTRSHLNRVATSGARHHAAGQTLTRPTTRRASDADRVKLGCYRDVEGLDRTLLGMLEHVS